MSKPSLTSAENPGSPSSAQWLLEAIIGSSDDAIITKSLDGVITGWNPAAERIFGYAAAEVIGRPVSILVPPDLGAEVPEMLARIRQGQRIEHLETTRLRKDGQRIDVLLTLSPVVDHRGKVVGASKIVRDITEQNRSLRQTRLERQRLQVTLASIGEGVIVTDMAGSVEYLNPVAEDLTGWRKEEAAGQPLEAVFSIINEKTRQRAENPVALALRQGVTVGLANHTLLLSRNGTEHAIDDSAAPIRDPSGAVSGVIMIFRDVTGARAATLFRQRLSAIVESSDDAIIGKDLNGIVTSWNNGAQRMFGYLPAEAIGRPITILIPAERLAEEAEILRALRRGERVDHFETVRVTKDGRLLDVSLTISPIRDSEGNFVGASKIARDITEQKRSARELEAAHRKLKQRAAELQRLVGERTAQLSESLQELETFASGLSHDLKAPLRAIGNYAEMLHDEYGRQLPAEGQEFARRVVQSCSQLTRFVDNVTAYMRLRNAGVQLQSVALDELVPRVIEEHTPARQAGAEIALERPLLAVRGTEALLTQVIANLVSNGVKFIPPGRRPKVKIWTERRNNRVRLWVQDNGIGIAAPDREKVFELFARLHPAHRYEGTGIGLAVVQRAVERMAGQAGVESEEGQGSRFWVELNPAGSDAQR